MKTTWFLRAAAAAVVAGVLGAPQASAAGDTPAESKWQAADDADWRQLFAAAREGFRPLPDRLSIRRSELLRTLTDLRRLLDDGPAEDAEAWSEYFRLAEVQAALSADVPRQLEVFNTLRRRLTADVPGLELPEVVAFRTAAVRYVATLRQGETNLEQEYGRRLAELQAALASYETAPTQATADRIGAALAWLDEAEQAPELVAAVRARWSQPNWIIRIGTEFVRGYAEREVAERCRHSAVILGTRIVGPTATTAKLQLATVDNPDRAELQLRLSGVSECERNVGTNGPAVIHSESTSRFEVSRRLMFDPVWGLAAGDAQTHCKSDVTLRDIDVQPRRLPRLTKSLATEVAWNKAREQHAAAEREVARLVSTRVEQRLDAELADPLTRAQEFFHQAAYVKPLRLDELPEISSRSTTDYVELALHRARPHQLAAPDAPPAFTAASAFGVAVHQSNFNNTSAAAGLLHGAVQTDEQIEQYASKLAGEVPPALRVFRNSVRWSAELDAEEEFSLTFDDGRADATFHTLAWTIGERRFERPIDVRIVYAIENTRLGMLFTRQGAIEIRPADGKPWKADEREQLLPHIEAKTAALFPASGRFNALIVPHGEAFGPLGSVELKQLVCDDGWLVLGYQSTATP